MRWSSAYDVLKSPQGRVLGDMKLSSDAFDIARAEQTVGSKHQDEDERVEGHHLVQVAPVQPLRVGVVRNVFEYADVEAARYRTDDRIEPAENHGREDLDAKKRKRRRHTVDCADRDTGERGNHRRDSPRPREYLAYRDAERLRHLLVIGGRAHREAHARGLEEPCKAA